MEGFLRQRSSDPRFALRAPRPEIALSGGSAPWYASSNLPGGLTRDDLIFVTKHNASALKRTWHQAATTDARNSASSSSESDGNGSRRSKRTKEEKKSKGRAPGYDGPDKCQNGYKKVPEKLRGERGSCEQA